jgi:hypothetical protein
MLRVVATLLLLFQLGPLVGTALCLHAGGPQHAQCGMAGHKVATDPVLSQSEPGGIQSCALASVCAPAVPAVPRFAPQLNFVIPTYRIAVVKPPSLAPGDPLAPPLHPPRV